MSNPPKPFADEELVDELLDESDPLDPAPEPAASEVDEPELEDGELGLDEAVDEDVRRPGGVTDLLRKAVVAGLGAVFMTEEGIRALVKDLKLPKDVMGFVVGQAERSKTELYRIIGEEMRRFFESAALRREIGRLLSDMTVEIKAEVRLRADGQMPDVKVTSTHVASHSARRTKKKS